MEFSQIISNIYPNEALPPMVIVLIRRYILSKHVPNIYLTYTLYVPYDSRIWQRCQVYVRYMIGTYRTNIYRAFNAITIGSQRFLWYMLPVFAKIQQFQYTSSTSASNLHSQVVYLLEKRRITMSNTAFHFQRNAVLLFALWGAINNSAIFFVWIG